MKKIFNLKFLLVALIVLMLLIICSSQFFIVQRSFNISKTEKDSVISLAAKSLVAKDVPVGSLLIYNGKIIGTGYNTVLRDSNAAGHAEINAISEAVRKLGLKNFSSLNRDSLFLITTFEPCMMCRGAILEYNIKHVAFMKSKGMMHWVKNDSKQLRYEWNKLQTNGSDLQDSLFMLHPDFPGK